MGDEGRLRGQKGNSELNGLPVPVLAVLALESDALDHLILLVQKSELRAETKVADAQEADLFEHVLPCEFDRQCIAGKEVL